MRREEDWTPELKELLEKSVARMTLLHMELRIELLRNELKKIQEEKHEKG
jgi:hypothetical protein